MSSPVWGGANVVSDERSSLPARVDVAIVGAGLTGLSAAYHLLRDRPGLAVAILDARGPGYGASGRTTGMVTPGIGQDFARLVDRIGPTRAAEAYRLTREAVHEVAALVSREGIECEHLARGQLVVAHGEKGPPRIARQAEALSRSGQPCVALGAAELAGRVRLRFASSRGTLAGYFLPDAASVNPVMLVEGLARAVRLRGASIVFPAAVRNLVHGSVVTLELSDGDRLAASQVILATGGHAPALAGNTGRILPLTLTVAATRPLDEAELARIGWAGRECIVDSRRFFSYFRLTKDRRVVFGGGVPLWGAMAAALPRSFGPLERELRSAFEGGESFDVAHRWCGTIDYTLDSLPMIGPVHGRENVTYVGGFCGHGIALGIRAGRSIAEGVLRGRVTPLLPWLREKPAWIPGEWVRKQCFAAASYWMRLRDA